MIILLILVIIVLTIIYTFLRIDKEKINITENFESNESNESTKPVKKMSNSHKRNFIENFMAFPNKQKFCPNLYNSNAKYWTKLPLKYGKGLYVKYNCSMCYYKITRSIMCFKNQGKYKICKMNEDDLDVLQNYYNKHEKKLDFTYQIHKYDKYIGKPVLKYKYKGIYYPVQLLKTKTQMDYKDIIDNDIYRTDFNCKKIKDIKKNSEKRKKKKTVESDEESDNDESEQNNEKNTESVFSFFDML